MRKFVVLKYLPLVAIFALFLANSVVADVKVEQKSKFTLHGAVGTLINMFSSAGNEIKSTTYVKGDFSRTDSKDDITIVDLQNGRFITIYPNKKEYSILTFEDMKKKMAETAEQLKSRNQEEPQQEEAEEATQGKEPDYEVLFDVNRTGEAKKINGMDTKQIIMTITIKKKGVALEDSGGMVITADQWLTDNVPGYHELQQFQQKTAQKMDFPYSGKDLASGFATIFYQYPQLQEGFSKLSKELEKTGQVPVQTTTTVEVVKSKLQMAQSPETSEESEQTEAPSVNKMLGGFAKKMMKKKEKPSNRSQLMDIYNEISKVENKDLDASLFEIPSGYKEAKPF